VVTGGICYAAEYGVRSTDKMKGTYGSSKVIGGTSDV